MTKGHYELGNELRGFMTGDFEDDETAWDTLSAAFDRAFPSVSGRYVVLTKVIRYETTTGGNEDPLDLITYKSRIDRIDPNCT